MTLQEVLLLLRSYGKKITQLPNATVPLSGGEKAEIVQAGINVQVDISEFGVTTGTKWVHIGDWDLSADTLPSGAEDMNTYKVSVAGNIDFGLGPEEVPEGSLIVFLGGDNQDGVNWHLI